jgi:hypothetical protein
VTTEPLAVKTKDAAIAELAKTKPEYARALSGENPPLHNRPKDETYPFIRVATFGIIIPIFVAGFLINTLAYFAFTPVYMRTNSFGRLVGAVIVAFIAVGCFNYARAVHSKPRLKYARPSPFPMKLYQCDYNFDYEGNQLTFALEYEIPSSFKAATDLQTLIVLRFRTITEAFIEARTAQYLELCKMRNESRSWEGFVRSFSADELECAFVPEFGRAVYEAQVPVFRFKAAKKTIFAPANHTPAPRRGFIGTSS